MDQIRPIYKKLLVAAIVIFVIGVGIALSDLYYKVCTMEHTILHLTGKH